MTADKRDDEPEATEPPAKEPKPPAPKPTPIKRRLAFGSRVRRVTNTNLPGSGHW